MLRNELRVTLPEFKLAMDRFRQYRNAKKAPTVLVAFDGGFLSFEVEGVTAVVRAEGEWHGRTWISAFYLASFSKVPPTTNPVLIRYEADRIRIGSLSLGCEWETISSRFVRRVENPTLIDLLAFDRVLPRNEIHASGLLDKIDLAKRKTQTAVTKAAKALSELDVPADDLWGLVELQIQSRIKQAPI